MGLFYFPLPAEYFNNNETDYRGNQCYHNAHTYSGHEMGKLDLSVPAGTEVYSMISGQVIMSGGFTSGYHAVCVKNTTGEEYWCDTGESEDLVVRHLHIDPCVSEGDSVAQGQLIGTVLADDRRSTSEDPWSPHLHVDFTHNGYDGSLLMSPRYGSVEAMPSQMQEPIRMWIGQSASQNYIGRCWEVFASEGMITSGGEGILVTPYDADYPEVNTFCITSYPPISGNSVGGSGHSLLSFRSKTALKNGVNGSVACKFLHNHYGYTYGAEGRTKIRIELSAPSGIPEDVIEKVNGYYYLDDSSEAYTQKNGTAFFVDFFYNDSNQNEDNNSSKEDIQILLSDDVNLQNIQVYICN